MKGATKHIILICAAWVLLLLPSLAISGPAYVRDYFDYADEPLAESQLQLIDEMHTRRAIQLVRDGRYRDALMDLKFTLNHWPNHPQALMILVGVSQLAESPRIPGVYFEKALKLFPQHALTHAQYGKYLVDLGEANAGLEKLKYAVEKEPTLMPAHVWLSEAYAAMGDKGRASDEMEQAKKLGYVGDLSGGLGARR